jgi:hypothetical protein
VKFRLVCVGCGKRIEHLGEARARGGAGVDWLLVERCALGPNRPDDVLQLADAATMSKDGMETGGAGARAAALGARPDYPRGRGIG